MIDGLGGGVVISGVSFSAVVVLRLGVSPLW